MKFAKLSFLVVSLFICFVGYKLLPADSHKGSLSIAKIFGNQFESSASLENCQGFFDFSVDLEEDETLNLIKKSSIYTLICLFFSSFFMFSFCQEKMKLAKKSLSFRRRGPLTLLQIFRV